jgi:hypothetical protein
MKAFFSNRTPGLDMCNVLTGEFNSQQGVTKRETKQLKKCWDIKSRAKKTLAKEQRENKLTASSCTTLMWLHR